MIAPSAAPSGAQINGREQTTIQHERSEYVARSGQPVEIWNVEHKSKAETEVGKRTLFLQAHDQKVVKERRYRWRAGRDGALLLRRHV